MAAPSHVPTAPNQPKVYQSPPRREGSWRADRPGEVIGAAQPAGARMGNQGPDQGYVYKVLAELRDELQLADGEHRADVETGLAAVALRRASLYGRAPMRGDVALAMEILGYRRSAQDELVRWRQARMEGLHHTAIHYARARALADAVPEATLRMNVEAAGEASKADWREPLGLLET